MKKQTTITENKLVTREDDLNLQIEELMKQLSETQASLKQEQEKNELLQAYKDETIWRLIDEDFLSQCEENSNVLPYNADGSISVTAKAMLEDAKRSFGIEDWSEHVSIWLSLH